MTILLKESRDGILLPVKVNPGARRNSITGQHAGSLKVSVCQAPEKGKANNAVAAVLAAELDLKPNQIVLISGPASQQKTFLVTGIDRVTLEQRLGAALGNEPEIHVD